jgi:DNA-directed RNA polymerase subunit RPC12/RpoP
MNVEVPIAPLCCVGCGAAVPLAEGASVRCAYCGAETPIPPTHLGLQAAHRAFAQNRDLARQLYGELGRPPSWLTRALGRSANASAPIALNVLVALVMITRKLPWLGIAMFCAAMYAIGYPVAAVIRLGWWLGGATRLDLPISPFVVLPIAVGVVAIFFGIPFVRWRREVAIKDARIGAHASLAATPPVRPGGPSRCRMCGAALDVPPGALGVPCVYCKSDNLVALPPEWVARAKASVHTDFVQIDTALDALRAAGGTAHESYWWLFVGTVVTLLASLCVAALLESGRMYF